MPHVRMTQQVMIKNRKLFHRCGNGEFQTGRGKETVALTSNWRERWPSHRRPTWRTWREPEWCRWNQWSVSFVSVKKKKKGVTAIFSAAPIWHQLMLRRHAHCPSHLLLWGSIDRGQDSFVGDFDVDGRLALDATSTGLGARCFFSSSLKQIIGVNAGNNGLLAL